MLYLTEKVIADVTMLIVGSIADKPITTKFKIFSVPLSELRPRFLLFDEQSFLTLASENIRCPVRPSVRPSFGWGGGAPHWLARGRGPSGPFLLAIGYFRVLASFLPAPSC